MNFRETERGHRQNPRDRESSGKAEAHGSEESSESTAVVKSRRESSEAEKEAESSVWLAPPLRAGAGGTGDLQRGIAGGRGPRCPGMGTGCAASENISLLPEESCN